MIYILNLADDYFHEKNCKIYIFTCKNRNIRIAEIYVCFFNKNLSELIEKLR